MPEFHWLLIFSTLGIFVGFFAGLLGIGGGGIMVPILTTVFIAQGFPIEYVVHSALATSMATIIITAIASLRAHHKHGAVLWNIVYRISPGILVGAFSATLITPYVSSVPLALFFACFMTYVSIQMVLNIKPKPSRQLPNTTGLTGVGIGIGGISSLVAIGGGTLTVPFLTWCNVTIQKAIGTSSAIGLPIAIAGTLGYLVSGWGTEGLPEYSLGYVYLPAVFAVSIVSYFTAPIGAMWAHRLPVDKLKKVFAVLFILLALKMLHSIFVA